MINIKKFRHVAIVTNNYNKLVDFYTTVLGLKFIREFAIESEDFRNGIGIPNAKAKGTHLHTPDGSFEFEIFEFSHPKTENNDSVSIANKIGYRHIAFIVDNLEDAVYKLKKLNIEFFSEPITVKEPENVAGFRFVYFKDPDGNIIELNQLPNNLY